MIGGFLGAGKTTAILALARYLTSRGRRVGLITNDQSFGLVDTALAQSQGFPVEEITGGCFCCKFQSLMEAADRLSRQTLPDVFLAEPVGSCTDLRAAVSYPLQRLYGDDFRVAPLSVLVDPIRALRILNVEPGRAFSGKVLYVYGKQLEEAEVIVINKCDLLSPERLRSLEDALRAAFPRAQLFAVSARRGDGLEAWFGRIVGEELAPVPAPEVDYDVYAEGEALLGWLNTGFRLSSREAFDGNALLLDLARSIQEELRDLEIAHLKMTLLPDEEGNDIGVLNLVRNDASPEMSHTLHETLQSGELILNLRAEGDPETLRSAVLEAVRDRLETAGGLQVAVQHVEHFRPGRPNPTYRMTTVQA
jgi:Ni2+-binding GTPase involved in maturation of urease and hydrogenase